MRTEAILPLLMGTLLFASGCKENPTALKAQSPDAAILPAAGNAAPTRALRARTPIRALLVLRDELQLTDLQVQQLVRIQAELVRANQPLRQRTRAQLGRDGSAVAAFRDLAPEQRRAKLQELREERRQQWEQMSAEQRQAFREHRRESIRQVQPLVQQVRENTRSALEQARAVLTPDQQALVKSKLEARRARNHT